MTISFNLKVDDWVAFQQYHRGQKIPFYNIIYPAIIVLCLFLAGICIGYCIYYRTNSSVVWVSAACFLTLLYILYLRKKSLAHIREIGLELEKKNPDAFGLISMNIDQDGITVLSRKISKTIPWKEMDRLKENKSYFFLYSKKGVVYIVPKREIKDQSEFRRELTNYIG